MKQMYLVQLNRKNKILHTMYLCKNCAEQSIANLAGTNLGNLSWTFVLGPVPDETKCGDCEDDNDSQTSKVYVS